MYECIYERMYCRYAQMYEVDVCMSVAYVKQVRVMKECTVSMHRCMKQICE